jgi:hypothetical protein
VTTLERNHRLIILQIQFWTTEMVWTCWNVEKKGKRNVERNIKKMGSSKEQTTKPNHWSQWWQYLRNMYQLLFIHLIFVTLKTVNKSNGKAGEMEDSYKMWPCTKQNKLMYSSDINHKTNLHSTWNLPMMAQNKSHNHRLHWTCVRNSETCKIKNTRNWYVKITVQTPLIIVAVTSGQNIKNVT